MNGQSGVFSNAYVYRDLAEDNSWVGTLVTGLGEAIGSEFGGPVGAKIGEHGAGGLLFFIQNASAIAGNAQTFSQEVGDWRSWASMMGGISGGTLGR